MQRFVNFSTEAFFRKGFCDEMNAIVQDSVVAQDVVGITGHEENLKGRLQGPDALGQLASVHTRHDNIGQQEVEPRGRRRHFDAFLGTARFQNRIAEAPEHHTGQFANVGIVFGDEDGLSVTWKRFVALGLDVGSGKSGCCG
jgi:hypothetical protein